MFLFVIYPYVNISIQIYTFCEINEQIVVLINRDKSQMNKTHLIGELNKQIFNIKQNVCVHIDILNLQ